MIGAVEWTIDAPWRMEPPYSGIPITIAIDDADAQYDADPAIPLHHFCGATVQQLTKVQPTPGNMYRKYTPAQFHEIESEAKWPASSDGPAFHELARIWSGDVPSDDILNVSRSASWAATLIFDPFTTPVAGSNIFLQVTAVVSDNGSCPPLADMPFETTPDHIGLGGPREQRVGAAQIYRSVLKVHYGSQLPKFDSRWAYGDLHYHSQGTDNDGESGLPYRPVLQAMKAIGLDFALASDHASDGVQITGKGGVFVAPIPDLPIYGDIGVFLNAMKDAAIDAINAGIDPGLPYETQADALRDMSARRWAAMHAWLNNPDGANQQVVAGPIAGGRTAQIFVGGEVDAIPEISQAERDSGVMSFGNGKTYDWRTACTSVPSAILQVEQATTFRLCPTGSNGLVQQASEGSRWLLRDVQVLGSLYFARQHFLHFPTDATRTDAFVSSRTTMYGGAFRRFKDILAEDYPETNSKGVFFLAHPIDYPKGSGFGRLGPDMIPYTDTQLKTVFDSPSFLGLQLWNQDDHVRSDHSNFFPRATLLRYMEGIIPDDVWTKLTTWESGDQHDHVSYLHHGAKTWDRMLLWGLDPAQKPHFVPAGSPRKVFMAGGSDAHGDLNWHQVGALIGILYGTDTSIGTPRNLVFVGNRNASVSAQGRTGSAFAQGDVVRGLQSGNFSVTDGPIIRVAIDTNGNGQIDDTDTPMGGDFQWPRNGTVPLLVQWKSTSEWGPVTDVDIYVGSYASGADAKTYAPLDHALRMPDDPSASTTKSYVYNNQSYQLYPDGYAADQTGKLSFAPASNEQYSGTRLITLTPSAYPAFTKGTCRTTSFCDPELNTCTTHESCTATAAAAPSRMYVRAMLKADATVPVYSSTTGSAFGYGLERLGYSNPIWLKPEPVLVKTM